MKYVFFGTPQFAAIILEKLIIADIRPIGVVCAPDKPVGRKQVLTAPLTKILAQKHEIEVLQPKSTKDDEFLEKLRNLDLDLIVVVAYGKILPKKLIEIPRHGTMNVHPSLLPQWRGPSPIQYALLNGDEETGVTIMLLDEKMDHGPILKNTRVKIKDQNYVALSKRLTEEGARLLIETIPRWIDGEIEPKKQDHSKATYSKIITKEDGKIYWSKSAEEIEHMTRAFYPWPGAYTFWKTSKGVKKLNIVDAKQITWVSDALGASNIQRLKFGEVFLGKTNILAVRCQEGALILKKLQLEGGRAVTAQEFLNGHQDFVGAVLNSNNETLLRQGYGRARQ